MKYAVLILCTLLFFSACKKSVGSIPTNTKTNQLFPLIKNSKWIYIDSFYDYDGTFYGFDTFYLKPADTIIKNNVAYTPITDQWDEAIFTIRSDDSVAYILEPPGESLFFQSPLPANQSSINNSYFNNLLQSDIYTNQLMLNHFACYKIVVTQDDGNWAHFKQEEFYFSVGVGIVKGYTRWKNSDGSLYTSDSYVLLAYVD